MSRIQLTQRQIEVLESAMRGETAKETAARYGIAFGTVRATRAHILMKLRARSMAEAIAIYLGANDEPS